MRPLVIALVGLALAGPSAAQGQPASADEGVQPFIGSRLEIDNFQGWHADRYLAPDHTYTQTGSDGDVTGEWSVEDGKLCTEQKTPPPAGDRAKRYCNLGPGRKLGDTWQDRDPVTGNPIFFSLQPIPATP